MLFYGSFYYILGIYTAYNYMLINIINSFI